LYTAHYKLLICSNFSNPKQVSFQQSFEFYTSSVSERRILGARRTSSSAIYRSASCRGRPEATNYYVDVADACSSAVFLRYTVHSFVIISSAACSISSRQTGWLYTEILHCFTLICAECIINHRTLHRRRSLDAKSYMYYFFQRNCRDWKIGRLEAHAQHRLVEFLGEGESANCVDVVFLEKITFDICLCVSVCRCFCVQDN